MSSIKEWLSSIHLPQYLSVFSANGYKSLDERAYLTEADLDDLQITLAGHRKRILTNLPSKKSEFVPLGMSENERYYEVDDEGDDEIYASPPPPRTITKPTEASSAPPLLPAKQKKGSFSELDTKFGIVTPDAGERLGASFPTNFEENQPDAMVTTPKPKPVPKPRSRPSTQKRPVAPPRVKSSQKWERPSSEAINEEPQETTEAKPDSSPSSGESPSSSSRGATLKLLRLVEDSNKLLRSDPRTIPDVRPPSDGAESDELNFVEAANQPASSLHQLSSGFPEITDRVVIGADKEDIVLSKEEEENLQNELRNREDDLSRLVPRLSTQDSSTDERNSQSSFYQGVWQMGVGEKLRESSETSAPPKLVLPLARGGSSSRSSECESEASFDAPPPSFAPPPLPDALKVPAMAANPCQDEQIPAEVAPRPPDINVLPVAAAPVLPPRPVDKAISRPPPLTPKSPENPHFSLPSSNDDDVTPTKFGNSLASSDVTSNKAPFCSGSLQRARNHYTPTASPPQPNAKLLAEEAFKRVRGDAEPSPPRLKPRNPEPTPPSPPAVRGNPFRESAVADPESLYSVQQSYDDEAPCYAGNK